MVEVRPTGSDPLLGRIVGPYRVLHHLLGDDHAGGYVAEHLYLDRRVVLKLFGPLSAGPTSSGVDRVLDQARALSRAKHDSVLAPLDLGEAGDGVVYLALELPSGPTLARQVAEHGALAWPRARAIGRQVGAALRAVGKESAATAAPPASRVFVTTAGKAVDVVKVDFTTSGGLEIAAGGPALDPVLALGRLLYLMVTGHPPVAGLAGEPPPDPVLSWPELEIPPDADALIMRALDPEPAKRWADLSALLGALGAPADEDGDAATGAEVSRGDPPGDAWRALSLGRADDDADPSRSFGRGMFVRPSRRALISTGVGVGAALLLGVIMFASPGDRKGARREGDVPASPAVAPPVAPPSPVAPSPAPSSAVAPSPAPPSVVAPPPAPSSVVAPATSGAAPSPSVARASTAPGFKGDGGVTAGEPKATSAVASASSSLATNGGAGGTARPAVAGGACAVTLGSKPWAEVWIDGRRAGFTPFGDYPVTCGEHEVVFTSSELGIERRVSIVVRPGQRFKRVVDLTVPAPAPAPASPASPASAASPIPGAAPGAAAAATVPPVAAVPPLHPGCTLSLGSRPWSEVWIDGRRAGVTPLVDFSVPCGKHDLLFISREANVERRETIVVEEGQHVKKTVTIVEGD